MGFIEAFKIFYTAHYKKLILLPLVLVVLSLILLVQSYRETGDIFIKDVSLKGGISATLLTEESLDPVALETALRSSFDEVIVRKISDFGSNTQRGLLIETSSQDEQALHAALAQHIPFPINEDRLSIELIGASLGNSFYRQMLRAMLFAYLFMTVVVFITFRSVLPSFTTVFASAADILVAIAVTHLVGLPISTAGIAAFLMLIGYSVDNDILLKARVLKKSESTPFASTFSSMATGLTMSATALITVLLGWAFSTVPVFSEMFMILSIGLFTDIVMTYCMSAPVLLWDLERKEKRST